MSKNTNMIVVSGNIVRDVELNESQTLIRFCIASSESVKKDGKWEEYTNYFDIKGFGGTVKLAPYLIKGTKVIITGTLHQENGKTRRMPTMIQSHTIYFLPAFAKIMRARRTAAL